MMFNFDFIYVHAIGAIISLAGLLVATVSLQNKKMLRRLEALETLPEQIKSTSAYKSAEGYLKRRTAQDSENSTVRSSKLPMTLLALIVFSGTAITYFGADQITRTTTPSYVLGGVSVFSGVSSEEIVKYQSSTLYMGSMAFLGAYIWCLTNLIMRLNNDDVTPSTYYFLSLRILKACLMAGVFRQFMDVFDSGVVIKEYPAWIGMIGFVIGLKPTLGVDWIFNVVIAKFFGSSLKKKDLNEESLPVNKPLLLIEGVNDDRSERLSEIDIDDIQKLAYENPVLIWLKTPYSMELIIDWISQAYLCLIVSDNLVKQLRFSGVRDIFSYIEVVNDPSCADKLEKLLGMDVVFLRKQISSLEETPAFLRIVQLRKATRPLVS